MKTIDLGPLRGLGPLFSRNGAILGHSPIRKVFNLHLFCVISMFVTEKNAYIKDLNALRILIYFLCIYLGEKGGGGALMHVYVWEHIVSLYYRTA